MLQQLDAGEIDVENIPFPNEAYFSLDSFVNKQHWRISETENPKIVVPLSQHPPKSHSGGRHFFHAKGLLQRCTCTSCVTL